jgi:hypothetical protein
VEVPGPVSLDFSNALFSQHRFGAVPVRYFFIGSSSKPGSRPARLHHSTMLDRRARLRGRQEKKAGVSTGLFHHRYFRFALMNSALWTPMAMPMTMPMKMHTT